MLVTFPFGLFASAAIFDLADVAGGPALLGEVGYWSAVAALVAAGLVAVAGLVDMWDVRVDRTLRTAATANLLNAAMAALFLLTCLMRAHAPQRGATGVQFLTELLALAVGSVGVWQGTRLMRQFDRRGAARRNRHDAISDLPASTVEIIRPPA
jgi:uncharacterized membrane protein